MQRNELKKNLINLPKVFWDMMRWHLEWEDQKAVARLMQQLDEQIAAANWKPLNLANRFDFQLKNYKLQTYAAQLGYTQLPDEKIFWLTRDNKNDTNQNNVQTAFYRALLFTRDRNQQKVFLFRKLVTDMLRKAELHNQEDNPRLPLNQFPLLALLNYMHAAIKYILVTDDEEQTEQTDQSEPMTKRKDQILAFCAELLKYPLDDKARLQLTMVESLYKTVNISQENRSVLNHPLYASRELFRDQDSYLTLKKSQRFMELTATGDFSSKKAQITIAAIIRISRKLLHKGLWDQCHEHAMCYLQPIGWIFLAQSPTFFENEDNIALLRNVISLDGSGQARLRKALKSLSELPDLDAITRVQIATILGEQTISAFTLCNLNILSTKDKLPFWPKDCSFISFLESYRDYQASCESIINIQQVKPNTAAHRNLALLTLDEFIATQDQDNGTLKYLQYIYSPTPKIRAELLPGLTLTGVIKIVDTMDELGVTRFGESYLHKELVKRCNESPQPFDKAWDTLMEQTLVKKLLHVNVPYLSRFLLKCIVGEITIDDHQEKMITAINNYVPNAVYMSTHDLETFQKFNPYILLSHQLPSRAAMNKVLNVLTPGQTMRLVKNLPIATEEVGRHGIDWDKKAQETLIYLFENRMGKIKYFLEQKCSTELLDNYKRHNRVSLAFLIKNITNIVRQHNKKPKLVLQQLSQVAAAVTPLRNWGEKRVSWDILELILHGIFYSASSNTKQAVDVIVKCKIDGRMSSNGLTQKGFDRLFKSNILNSWTDFGLTAWSVIAFLVKLADKDESICKRLHSAKGWQALHAFFGENGFHRNIDEFFAIVGSVEALLGFCQFATSIKLVSGRGHNNIGYNGEMLARGYSKIVNEPAYHWFSFDTVYDCNFLGYFFAHYDDLKQAYANDMQKLEQRFRALTRSESVFTYRGADEPARWSYVQALSTIKRDNDDQNDWLAFLFSPVAMDYQLVEKLLQVGIMNFYAFSVSRNNPKQKNKIINVIEFYNRQGIYAKIEANCQHAHIFGMYFNKSNLAKLAKVKVDNVSCLRLLSRNSYKDALQTLIRVSAEVQENTTYCLPPLKNRGYNKNYLLAFKNAPIKKCCPEVVQLIVELANAGTLSDPDMLVQVLSEVANEIDESYDWQRFQLEIKQRLQEKSDTELQEPADETEAEQTELAAQSPAQQAKLKRRKTRTSSAPPTPSAVAEGATSSQVTIFTEPWQRRLRRRTPVENDNNRDEGFSDDSSEEQITQTNKRLRNGSDNEKEHELEPSYKR